MRGGDSEPPRPDFQQRKGVTAAELAKERERANRRVQARKDEMTPQVSAARKEFARRRLLKMTRGGSAPSGDDRR